MGPWMAYEIIRKRLAGIVPFNTLVGIEIVSLGDGVAEAVLSYRQELTNHIETVHASAIFALAEATSGAAMSGAFAPMITSVRPVATSATIEFSKTARTTLTARARVMGETAGLRAGLETAGKVTFDVQVMIADDTETEVARVTVAWHVGQKR
jgi:uncharacterized protein (TIGR00369 family)